VGQHSLINSVILVKIQRPMCTSFQSGRNLSFCISNILCNRIPVCCRTRAFSSLILFNFHNARFPASVTPTHTRGVRALSSRISKTIRYFDMNELELIQKMTGNSCILFWNLESAISKETNRRWGEKETSPTTARTSMSSYLDGEYQYCQRAIPCIQRS
jgi:hypothetical protein